MSEPSGQRDNSLDATVPDQPYNDVTAATSDENSAQAAQPRSSNPLVVMGRVIQEEGVPALFAGSLPRAVRAIGSGAIQFAAYELTQNSFR